MIQLIVYYFRLENLDFSDKFSDVGSRKNQLMPLSLPINVFELHHEDFLQMVHQQCGKTMVEILRYLEINSAESLLTVEDLFAFFLHDSPDLTEMKKKVGITLSDGKFRVKDGLLFQANSLIKALHTFQQQTNSSTSNDMTISSSLLDEYPILRQIIRMFENLSSQSDKCVNAFKYTAIETIISNYNCAKTRYSYNDSMREFALCVFILGGRNVYEFIRLNIPGFLPSLTVIQCLLDSKSNRIKEADFRYDLMSDYLQSQKTKFVFAAEDCTAVVPRIVYDCQTSTFIGFTPPLEYGLPQIDSFSTDSFSELENWFDTLTRSHFLNLQMVQPINQRPIPSSPFVLSAYGTDNRFKTDDILMKWMNMVNRCREEGVKVVGFATDCDSRYLRSMRLLMGFFADLPNQQIHLRDDAFHVDTPKVI